MMRAGGRGSKSERNQRGERCLGAGATARRKVAMRFCDSHA